MVCVCQVKALYVIGPCVLWVDGDGTVGHTDHLGIIVDAWVPPTKYMVDQIGRGVARQRPCIVRIDRERPFIHRSRGVVILLRPLLLRSQLQSPPAHGEIEGVEIVDARVSLRLRDDEFVAQAIRQPRYDLILQFQQIGDVFIEPVGPEMRAGFRIDQLCVDAHPVLLALHRAFEDVAHVELLADFLGVDGSCP